jgi:hypothetical protein
MLKFLVLSAISMICLTVFSDLSAQSGNTDASQAPVLDQKFVPENGGHELTAKGNGLQFNEQDYVVKRYDLNKDGSPDIIHVSKKVLNEKKGEVSLLTYVKMMDLNHDSKIDLWRFFDLESGVVSKEELDLDFDGKIDRTDYYINGVVRRSEFDFQFDESADIVKSFDEKGILIEIESDQSGNGKTDYWEYYRNGVLERIEKDTNNDGKSDVFKRPGDSGFTGIVDVDARFEIPEETASQEISEETPAQSAEEKSETAEAPNGEAEPEAKSETAEAPNSEAEPVVQAEESKEEPAQSADPENNAAQDSQQQSSEGAE